MVADDLLRAVFATVSSRLLRVHFGTQAVGRIALSRKALLGKGRSLLRCTMDRDISTLPLTPAQRVLLSSAGMPSPACLRAAGRVCYAIAPRYPHPHACCKPPHSRQVQALTPFQT